MQHKPKPAIELPNPGYHSLVLSPKGRWACLRLPRPLRQQPFRKVEALMRLDQLLLQPVHRVLELVDARLELVGVSRARGQPRARDLDDGARHDPRDRDNPDDDKSEVRIHGSILRSPGTRGY